MFFVEPKLSTTSTVTDNLICISDNDPDFDVLGKTAAQLGNARQTYLSQLGSRGPVQHRLLNGRCISACVESNSKSRPDYQFRVGGPCRSAQIENTVVCVCVCKGLTFVCT